MRKKQPQSILNSLVFLRLVHLKSEDDQGEYAQEPQQRDTFIPANQSTVTSPGSTTALVYPPQSNARTIGYIKSTIPPHIMLKNQQNILNQTTQPTLLNPPSHQTPTYQTLQPIPSPYNPTPQATNYQLLQPTPQTTNYQLLQPSPYTPVPQQSTATYQMVQPTTYAQGPQQPTPYVYPTTSNIYGYKKY